ncbi:hypothetical protein [Burkholderia ubonensis]|uniref:hypothetical protein n=1 Tax=Burkholderia ubonensis TaxID=101571 RepID=UPI000B1AE867|nr:hypothetical protein [Burkholderia ubonensis]
MSSLPSTVPRRKPDTVRRILDEGLIIVADAKAGFDPMAATEQTHLQGRATNSPAITSSVYFRQQYLPGRHTRLINLTAGMPLAMSIAFKSEVFWSAIAALVAFAGLLGSSTAGVYALLKAVRRRRLQSVLDRERQFYESQARRVVSVYNTSPEKSAADQYIRDVRDGLTTIGKLDEKQRRDAKEKLHELIDQLRATHATLVKTLKPFTTSNAAAFFDQFDKFNQDFGEVYDSGNIPHNARTHCGDVVGIVNELATQLALEAWHPICNIANSMQRADNDIIVPLMQGILAQTEVELSLISSLIRDKDFEKALWLKERYRFDVKNIYARLDETLMQMSQLRSQI